MIGPIVSLPRLCITSTSGGGGKTLLTLGLGRALRNKGHCVRPFKKGPDYIDAAWLALACGNPATNLDPFFLDAGALRNLFIAAIRGSCGHKNANAIALVEGNRGFYDGLDESGSCSTAALARALHCPVLLCINCVKTTRTIAALIKGMESFEAGHHFCGVILNKTGSTRHENSLRKAIEANTDLPVLGALPRMPHNPLPERHMGIASSGAALAENADAIMEKLADFISLHCNVEQIAARASMAPPLEAGPMAARQHANAATALAESGKPVIGYALDDALWFYYPENLAALENAGASLRRISFLDKSAQNQDAWNNLDGIYLGGGFPEDFAAALSASPCLAKLASHAREGMPIYAECGGLMLLCRNLVLESGIWPMGGIFSADVEWFAKPRGLGYVEGEVVADNPFFTKGLRIKGHEFHYSACAWNGTPPEFALRLARGTGMGANGIAAGLDGLTYRNVWGAYTHIFAPAVPEWAPNFVRAAAEWKKGRKKQRDI